MFVTGTTASPEYPTTLDAYNEGFIGIYDVFVSKFDSNLGTLLASTFIGGKHEDVSTSIALTGSGNVFVTGGTNSPDYPATLGAYNESYIGAYWPPYIELPPRFEWVNGLLASIPLFWNFNEDVFVSKLDNDLSAGGDLAPAVDLFADICPAEATTEDQSKLNPLRKFRDTVLSHSELGKEYTELYYTHAPEAARLLLKDSDLRSWAKDLLNDLVPEIRLLLEGSNNHLSLQHKIVIIFGFLYCLIKRTFSVRPPKW